MTDVLSPAEQAQQELDDLFLQHQEKVVAQDFEAARMLLDCFRALLSRRMHHEEEHLPELMARHNRQRALRAERIARHAAEHRRILELLDRICADFRRLLRPQPASLDVILLLEREARLKRLLAQHNERDLKELYRRLGREPLAATRALRRLPAPLAVP